MAFQFNDCLIPADFGSNKILAGCCCDIVCQVTNMGSDNTITNFETGSFGSNFDITNVFVDGNPISFPFTVLKDSKFEFSFTVCGPALDGVFDTVYFKFWDNLGSQVFEFPFESISMASQLDTTSIQFSGVPLGSSASYTVTLNNSIQCCGSYNIASGCSEVSTPTPSFSICTDQNQTFEIVWTPSQLGDQICDVSVYIDGCPNTATISVNGNAVEPPQPTDGGNDVSGFKRTGIDCPSCQPNRQTTNFNQTIKTTINQISRFTQPKGGGGRGTNFRK